MKVSSNKQRVRVKTSPNRMVQSIDRPPLVTKSTTSGDAEYYATIMSSPEMADVRRLLNQTLLAEEEKNNKEAKKVPEVNLDDVLKDVNKEELLEHFKDRKSAFKKHIIEQSVSLLAMQSAMYESLIAIRATVAPSTEMDSSSMMSMLERASELPYLTAVFDLLNIPEQTRKMVLQHHINRRWGPEPLRIPPINMGDTIVNVDGKGTRKRGGDNRRGNTEPQSRNSPLTMGALGVFKG